MNSLKMDLMGKTILIRKKALRPKYHPIPMRTFHNVKRVCKRTDYGTYEMVTILPPTERMDSHDVERLVETIRQPGGATIMVAEVNEG